MNWEALDACERPRHAAPETPGALAVALRSIGIASPPKPSRSPTRKVKVQLLPKAPGLRRCLAFERTPSSSPLPIFDRTPPRLGSPTRRKLLRRKRSFSAADVLDHPRFPARPHTPSRLRICSASRTVPASPMEVSSDASDDRASPVAGVALRRCFSAPMAVAEPVAQGSGLRGDGQPCRLPILEEGMSHPNMKCITSEVLAAAMAGEHQRNLVIVDCRYPYEFEGGHIAGAINLWTPELLEEFFLQDPHRFADKLIVFHCEFSSKRGPALHQHLRNIDRQIHLVTYPALFFPEIYILERGYCEFFQQQPAFCGGYRPMLDPAFGEQLSTSQHGARQSRSSVGAWKNSALVQYWSQVVEGVVPAVPEVRSDYASPTFLVQPDDEFSDSELDEACISIMLAAQ